MKKSVLHHTVKCKFHGCLMLYINYCSHLLSYEISKRIILILTVSAVFPEISFLHNSQLLPIQRSSFLQIRVVSQGIFQFHNSKHCVWLKLLSVSPCSCFLENDIFLGFYGIIFSKLCVISMGLTSFTTLKGIL